MLATVSVADFNVYGAVVRGSHHLRASDSVSSIFSFTVPVTRSHSARSDGLKFRDGRSTKTLSPATTTARNRTLRSKYFRLLPSNGLLLSCHLKGIPQASDRYAFQFNRG